LDTTSNRAGRPRDVAEYIKEQPLTALAIAGAAGFVLGGGITRRVGLAMLTVVGRVALRAVATSLILGIVTGDDYGRPSRRDRPQKAGFGDERHDNGRTDI
jgi:hypothetical protein